MSPTITIDGSEGEGGGQILRTSLALSVAQFEQESELVWKVTVGITRGAAPDMNESGCRMKPG